MSVVCEHSLATTRPTDADPDEEVFEVYDYDGNLLGTERRSIVHQKGLLHKAVYCYVFNPQGQLLIQQRSKQKKIGPGQWDLSVAEHLSPGESYRQGAERGLQEELGIAANLPSEPVTGTHVRKLVVPDKFYDYEMVQSFRLCGWEGEVHFNDAEVIAVDWISLDELEQQMEAEPLKFTEWFRAEMQLLDFFRGSGS